MEIRDIVALAEAWYDSGSFGAARANYLEAIETLEKRNAELESQAAEAAKWPHFTECPECSLEFRAWPISPPAEQGPKCKTCKDTRAVDDSTGPDDIATVPCPDCVGAQPEERKCVCKFNNPTSVCDSTFLDWGDGTCGRLSPGTQSLMACGHPRACHAEPSTKGERDEA